MIRTTDKQSYKLLKTIMYNAQYRPLAEEYRHALDALQGASEGFSKEQRDVLKRYQKAFLELHEAMLALALKKQR